jgi:hypothetical protein
MLGTWHRQKSELARAIAASRAKLGVKVVAHQTLLQAFSRAGIALDAGAAVIRRANRMHVDQDELVLAEHALLKLMADVAQHRAASERAMTSESREIAVSQVIYQESVGAMKAFDL